MLLALAACGAAPAASSSTAAPASSTAASEAAPAATEAAPAESSAAEPATEKRVLTYAQHNSKESTNGQYSQVFADYVNENSANLQVDVYYNGELGGIQEAMKGVAMGTIDLTASSFAQAATMYPPMEIFSIPYLCKSGDDNVKLMDLENNPVLQEIVAEFEASTTMVCIGTAASYEARHLTANFPVYTPADLAGKKICSITNDVYTIAVEGQENPYSTLVSYQLWDSQTHIMETGHLFDSTIGLINKDLWAELTPEDQQILRDAQKAMNDFRVDCGVPVLRAAAHHAASDHAVPADVHLASQPAVRRLMILFCVPSLPERGGRHADQSLVADWHEAMRERSGNDDPNRKRNPARSAGRQRYLLLSDIP